MERLDLDHEHSVVVPPLGVASSVVPEFSAPSRTANEASSTLGREVEPFESFADHGWVFYQRNFDDCGSEIGEVSDLECEPGVFDAEVDGDANFIGEVAELDKLVLGEWTVLAVGGHEAVVVFAEDVFELRFRYVHPRSNADYDISALDAFFQWGFVTHQLDLLRVLHASPSTLCGNGNADATF